MMDKRIEFYTHRIADFNKQIEQHKGTNNIIFYSRLFLFIAAFALFFFLISDHRAAAITALTITVIAFLLLLRFEIKTTRKMSFLKNMIHVNEIEMDIINNSFEKQSEGKEFIDKSHNYVSDLDIFGKRSIFQILNRTATFSGRVKLASWLTNPLALKDKIVERQDALKNIAQKPEWCQEFIALGFTNKVESTDKDVIADWLNEANNFSSVFLKVAAKVLPILTVVALGLYLFNIIESSAFTVLFFLQLFIVAAHTKKVNHIHNQLSRKFDSIEKYRALIAHIESEELDASILKRLKENFNNSGNSASGDINKLKKLVDALDARMNIVVAILLNGILLWDINSMQKIETWKTQHKEKFANWIATIGEFDAFISLSLYSFNNPDYTFPDLVKDDFTIDAVDLGHPLIDKKQLVKNSYQINGLPKVDLLTGANMAGKSTFLRTIGTNLILAMIGAPVCASKFRFTPILLFTSLRTNDSLQENESFFYAELKRLHLLIEHYKKGEHVFFLLDEILKGTNSKDQHAGSEALIEKIIKLNGTGIVATHDVELSKLSATYPDNVRNLCFEITIDNDKLNFDYKVKEGVCRTMNASFLMKQMEITD